MGYTKVTNKDITKIKKIRLHKFRSVSSEIEFDLAPITLFFGPNSVGKSSILSSLGFMAANLSACSPSRLDAQSNPGFKGTANFSLALAIESVLYNLKDHTGDSHSFEWGIFVSWLINYKSNKVTHLCEETVEIKVGDWKMLFQRTNGEWLAQGTIEAVGLIEATMPDLYEHIKGFDWDFSEYNPNDIDAYYKHVHGPIKNSQIRIDGMSEVFEQVLINYHSFMANIIHVGADRVRPKLRAFDLGDLSLPIREWWDGGRAWDLLEEGDDALLNAVNEWLAVKFQTGHYLQPTEIGLRIGLNEKKWRRMSVVDNQRDFQLELEQVGAGISHLVPFLVAGLTNTCATVIFEQPELHVHPALQAKLGDFLIDTMGSSGKRWIIETHSEHLLLRLLRRIRETSAGKAGVYNTINSEDVAVYYCTRGTDGLSAQRLHINDYGDFEDGWPREFFGERLEELMGPPITEQH